MRRIMLKSKIHKASVTDANIDYEGSVAIDTNLCKAADILNFEKVEIYNITNGARFSTYVIPGKDGEICLNGAAARLVQKGDRVIIASYAEYEEDEQDNFKPVLVFVDSKNMVKEVKSA